MENIEKLKKEADEMMKRSRGKVIGLAFKPRVQYIRKKEGKESIQKIEDTMADIGYPFAFSKAKSFHYYPIELGDLVILTTRELFGWSDKDIFDLAYNEMATSLLLKIFFTSFSKDINKTVQKGVQVWNKYLNYGKSGKLTYKIEPHKVILFLQAPLTHEIMCHYWAGSFKRISEIVIPGSNFGITEIRCGFKEHDELHTYEVTWK